MKILIIEDERGCQVALKQLLGSNECVFCDNLEQGLFALKTDQYDLVIADLKLPDCDPAETVARVMKNSGSAAVVALTGLDITKRPEIAEHADAYMEKQELPGASTFRAWLRDVVSQKASEGRVMQEAKRISAWLKWKSQEQLKP